MIKQSYDLFHAGGRLELSHLFIASLNSSVRIKVCLFVCWWEKCAVDKLRAIM